MRASRPLLAAPIAAALLVGCAPPEVVAPDAGPGGGFTPADAGVDAGVDDAGVIPDAGDVDAGPEPDAGPGIDAGPLDAGVDAGPPPPPPPSALFGVVYDFEYVEPTYLAAAKVSVTNVAPPPGEPADYFTYPSSDAIDGAYRIEGLPPSTYVNMYTRIEENVDGQTTSPAFVTRQRTKTALTGDSNHNPYVVKTGWLMNQAYYCGLYNNFAEARAQLTGDFTIYSTVLGTLLDANGNPVAGIAKDRLQVTLNGYVNNNTDYVCFLEDYDQGGTHVYRGGDSTVSTATGKFIIFKLKNGANGLGAGDARISVTEAVGEPLFNTQQLYLNAANMAVVTLQADDEIPPPVDLLDFERDILPIFAASLCTSCHVPGGPADGMGPNELYLGGVTPDEVYDSLVYPGTTCGTGPYHRVCTDNPSKSMLLTMPMYEDPPDGHPYANYEANDPEVLLMQAWIEQGANRYAEVVVEPPPGDATLLGVMQKLGPQGTNCTYCHTANKPGGPSGGMPLDGCVPDFAYPAEIDTNSETNPYYKRDCVYYHLKNQNRGEAPYQYRVNPAAAADSLLLKKPLTGSDLNHFPKVFDDTNDVTYQYVYEWVSGGANNDGTFPPVDGGPGPDGGPAPDAGPDT